MTRGKIEVVVGRVSDMDARLIATYVDESSADTRQESANVTLNGTIRGPFCENARTLPATFTFEQVKTANATPDAEAAIADPCIWSPELPHLYQVDVLAQQNEEVVAEFHGQIGIRRTSPRRAYDFSTS